MIVRNFKISIQGLKLETGVRWNEVKWRRKSCFKIYEIIDNDYFIPG